MRNAQTCIFYAVKQGEYDGKDKVEHVLCQVDCYFKLEREVKMCGEIGKICRVCVGDLS